MSSNNNTSDSASIIVVDEEMELSSLFEKFLTKEGYDVVSFSDPVLALEHFKQNSNRYSLIITDMRMPQICGIELAKKIKEINKNIKIFLMTAFDTRDLESNPDFQAVNIDRLLQKPISFSGLRKMINV